jgi:hypothetical protein
MLGLTCRGALNFQKAGGRNASLVGVKKIAKAASCGREKSNLFHLNGES